MIASLYSHEAWLLWRHKWKVHLALKPHVRVQASRKRLGENGEPLGGALRSNYPSLDLIERMCGASAWKRIVQSENGP